MTTFLIILAALTGYLLFVLASPAASCRKCRGWGTRSRRWQRRRGTCPRCGGTGIRFRPGAPLAHRALVALRHSRAKGDLTGQPWRPPRTRTPHDPEGGNHP